MLTDCNVHYIYERHLKSYGETSSSIFTSSHKQHALRQQQQIPMHSIHLLVLVFFCGKFLQGLEKDRQFEIDGNYIILIAN